MCLFVVDGTWSRRINSEIARDSRGVSVGSDKGVRSGMQTNCRKFYHNYLGRKFYYSGPDEGRTGNDAVDIYHHMLRRLEMEVINGNRSEISLVGWSRGAAIVTEIAHEIFLRGATSIPNIKFLGLFDPVERISENAPIGDRTWGKQINSNVQYCAQVVAGRRFMLKPFPLTYYARKPEINIDESRYHELLINQANHGHIGGDCENAFARQAYRFISDQAKRAGLEMNG